MRHESVTIPAGNGPKTPSSASSQHKIDWKGIGYLFSIAGVLLMGAEAIPKPSDPWWYWPALAGGVLTSIVGFALRYMAHLKQRREIEQTKREAERR
jgi:hypothetical protein